MTESRILLVEDEASTAELTAMVLRDASYVVDIAVTVDAAFSALTRNTYGLVILDLLLDRDATALHDALIRTNKLVLLVSGADADKVQHLALEHNWDYINKPVKPADLIARVAKIFSRSQPPAEPQVKPAVTETTAPEPTVQRTPTQPSLPKPPSKLENLEDGVAASPHPITWPESIHRTLSDLSRRFLRFAVSFMLFKLQLAGKLTPEVAIAMTACALGVESAIVAWKEKKLPAAVGLTLLPFLLAGVGELAQQAALIDAAGYSSAVLVPFAGYLTRARS